MMMILLLEGEEEAGCSPHSLKLPACRVPNPSSSTTDCFFVFLSVPSHQPGFGLAEHCRAVSVYEFKTSQDCSLPNPLQCSAKPRFGSLTGPILHEYIDMWLLQALLIQTRARADSGQRDIR